MDSLAQARETATRLLTAGEDSPVPSTVIGDDE